MLIDFTQVLKGFDDKPLQGSDGDITLQFICIDALLTDSKEDKQDGPEKLRRYELAKTIHNGKEMDLKTEDIVLIKDKIVKTRPTLIVGITEDMLEGKKDVGTNKPTKHPKPVDKDS